MVRDKIGFTLIELLIVVAIIAILAAIAIPNFLQAQVRAKVSRVQADMRSYATAIESYNIDNNTYPWPYETNVANRNVWHNDFAWNNYTWNGVPLALSTPIAYITNAVVFDPFPDLNNNQLGRSSYRFLDNAMIAFYVTNDGEAGWYNADSPIGVTWYGSVTGQPNSSIQWTLWSNGPDCLDGEGGPWVGYDPSNGTVSNGDIYRFGP